MPAPVVIAEIVRSGFVEGHHYGSWVVLDRDGSVLAAAGDVESPMLPRSCNKPLQALGMLEAGLSLDGELLALACASHSGEDFHVEGVRRILAGAGLTEDALQTPADWPLDDETRETLIRRGESKASILMNCSGKHAAMLATCVANGWPTSSYLAADHPLQRAIAETFARSTGEPVEHVAVDGCGAPLLSTSLTGTGPRLRLAGEGVVGCGAGHRGGDPRAPRVGLRDQARRADPAARDPRFDRQGRCGVLLCGRAARRSGVRDEDRRRWGAGASGRDGGPARGARHHWRARCGRRCGASYG